MATKQEIEKELKIALTEIGKITPWYEKKFKTWVFSHSLYPVECEGTTSQEVAENYPLYLREFILHRLNKNLDPLVESETKGRGGMRTGAGRPKGTTKEPKCRVYLPVDLAEWLKEKSHLVLVQQLMLKDMKHA